MMVGRTYPKVLRAAIAGLGLLFFSCSGENGEPPDPTAFFSEWARLARSAEERQTMVVEGREGWLFLASELRHLGAGKFWGEGAAAVSRARRPEWADPLPAILDFHRQLLAAGVELLIVPVPPKSIIYPDRIPSAIELGSEPPRLDVHHHAFYDTLRDNGVDVLDLTPLFLAERNQPRGALYCRQDTHWSGVGAVLAAEEIAKNVRSRPWFDAVPHLALVHEWRTVEIAGDLWKALGQDSLARERLSLRFVGTAEGELRPLEPDPSSPVVLLGDSHTLVFHAGGDLHAQGAGLADQLALELGFAVDLVGVRGSGSTAARINLLRRAQSDPDYWSAKRLVIWCFAARELTESDGWREVPIRPSR